MTAVEDRLNRLGQKARLVLLDLRAMHLARHDPPTPDAMKNHRDLGDPGRVGAGICELAEAGWIYLKPARVGGGRSLLLTEAGLSAGGALAKRLAHAAPTYKPRFNRACMACGKRFKSEGKHHRLCDHHRAEGLTPFTDGLGCGRKVGLS